ncbi:MAG: ABC transporter substrate-binding protein [Acidobacteria bacterium]|nr:ABC transporter substrate-binding protein [Acidobacteriota bacterium]
MLALALVTAACGDNDAADTTTTTTQGGGDQEPLVLGVVSGQTGFMSLFDIPVLQGVELAVAEINAAGGILGRQIEIIVIDHKTDFALLESAAIEAIEAGADIIITSCDFDVGGPTARAANEQGVLAIGCAGAPQYRDPEIRELPAWYLDQDHVDHGYALTGHKAQGVTTGRTFTIIGGSADREWAYVAMSRGRQANTLYLANPEPGDEQCTHLTHQDRGDALDTLTASLGRSSARVAAIDRIVGGGLSVGAPSTRSDLPRSVTRS